MCCRCCSIYYLYFSTSFLSFFVRVELEEASPESAIGSNQPIYVKTTEIQSNLTPSTSSPLEISATLTESASSESTSTTPSALQNNKVLTKSMPKPHNFIDDVGTVMLR